MHNINNHLQQVLFEHSTLGTTRFNPNCQQNDFNNLKIEQNFVYLIFHMLITD